MSPIGEHVDSCATSYPGSMPLTTSGDPRRRQMSPHTDSSSSSSSSSSIDCSSSFTENEPTFRRRSSAFIETGLIDEDPLLVARLRRNSRPKQQVRFQSKVEVFEPEVVNLLPPKPRPTNNETYEPMPPYFPTLPRLLFLAFVLVLILPCINSTPFLKAGITPIGADAGAVRSPVPQRRDALPQLSRRDDSTSVVCKRWAQQSAVVNGTLYLYGGRATTSSEQTSDTWNNDFLSLDLTKTWQISSPSLKGLSQPSGPPPVSDGYLWNSFDSLYLYGGEFSDTPATSPVPFSTWAYDIASSSWSESSNPQTVTGQNSASDTSSVQRAAEGAGVSIPNLGRGFYFGGHLDGYTTEGWSQSIARVYLTSLLEYTFPGYSNPTVNSGNPAGSEGLYRNITEGGTQDSAGFPERADGVLIYVPGYGKAGIVLGLAGGTNATFTQMNVIDVYDIDSSTWYKQATDGPTPEIRVNPCAVAVSAADGSSTQVYMYGGQNLIPYGQQKQYDDMWILTIPSFTWIQVDTSGQSTPPARAGHTCNVWDAQMVVVGGYVGQDLSCDSPGIYVFNTSGLAWQNTYQALDGSDSLSRQNSQRHDPSALQGSYGYQVPEKVRKVIGGNAVGAATVTAPAQSASQGPMATGKPLTYTVTQSNGAIATETSIPSTGNSGSSHNGDGGKDFRSPNVGAIVAGVIAGVLAILAAYLGFCAWLYRKQLQVYKNHVAMAQRQQLSGDPHFVGVAGGVGAKYSDKDRSQTSDSNRNSADNRSGEDGSGHSSTRRNNLLTNNPYRNVPGGEGLATAASSTEDLMQGHEPTFLGVFLNPRRSLRVVNRD